MSFVVDDNAGESFTLNTSVCHPSTNPSVQLSKIIISQRLLLLIFLLLLLQQQQQRRPSSIITTATTTTNERNRLRPKHRYSAAARRRMMDDLPPDFIITDSVKCYSCMSSVYEGLWDQLQKTYTKPMNFSKTCDKGQNQKGIGLVDCPSICIKMWEEVIIGGYPVLGFMRGCYDTMLLKGFNQTLVRWYRWLQRDSCHYYPRKDVLQLPFNMPGHIYICTCYSDGCNGSPSLSGANPFRLFNNPRRYSCYGWSRTLFLCTVFTVFWTYCHRLFCWTS